MTTVQHRKFDLGMNQDEASILLAEGYCYSARNMLFDKLGIARKRGGITGVGATANYNGDHLGALTMDDGSAQFYSLTSQLGSGLSNINIATGAFSGDLAPSATLYRGDPGGRPFQHFGFLIWPQWHDQTGSGLVGTIAVAGATGSKAHYIFAAPATVVVTAGDKRIVCDAADSPTTKMQVGQIVVIVSAANRYVGRVTQLVSTTNFEVYPTPTISIAAGSVTIVSTLNAHSAFNSDVAPASAYVSGQVGMSFQGRIVYGNCFRQDFHGANRIEMFPRRVYFSSVMLENDATALAAPAVFQGAVFLTNNGFPSSNFFDIPGNDPISAMAPTGFGDAVVFSPFKSFRLTGNLSTQFGTGQSVTWAIREIPNSVGCMSERSLQRTPRGLIFAHDSGIYTTDGNSMQPIMHQRMQRYWKSLVAGPSFVIYGSALIIGNHYYICGYSGTGPWGLMVNLDTLAWGTISGKTPTPASWIINSAVQDPLFSGTTWALEYTGALSASCVGGQLVRLESMFSPSSSSRADSDGTVVSFEYVSPPYSEGSPTDQKMWQAVTVQYNNLGGALVSITPQFLIDSADFNAGGSTLRLPSQDQYTVTAAPTTSPVTLTIGTHTLTIDQWVRVVNVFTMPELNGIWRIVAATATTITLGGSVGIGTYTAGGQVRAVDQHDFSLTSVLFQSTPGQQGMNTSAVAYRLNDSDLGAPGADLFELLAITHSYEERDAHVE